jgi:hypothetical protein
MTNGPFIELVPQSQKSASGTLGCQQPVQILTERHVLQ